jgi:hypothetical protein
MCVTAKPLRGGNMNEKQIEIALAKLRKLWHQNKTQIGKQRIEFIAKQMNKQLNKQLTGSLIPLQHGNTESVKQVTGIQYFTPDFVRVLQS